MEKVIGGGAPASQPRTVPSTITRVSTYTLDPLQALETEVSYFLASRVPHWILSTSLRVILRRVVIEKFPEADKSSLASGPHHWDWD